MNFINRHLTALILLSKRKLVWRWFRDECRPRHVPRVRIGRRDGFEEALVEAQSMITRMSVVVLGGVIGHFALVYVLSIRCWGSDS